MITTASPGYAFGLLIWSHITRETLSRHSLQLLLPGFSANRFTTWGAEKPVENQSQKGMTGHMSSYRQNPPFFFFLNYYHDCGVSKYLDVSTTLFECNGCSVNLHSTHWFVQKFSNYLKCGPGLTSKIIISLKVYGIYISITWYIHSAPISPPHRFKFLAK